jgi:hypothetical protein
VDGGAVWKGELGGEIRAEACYLRNDGLLLAGHDPRAKEAVVDAQGARREGASRFLRVCI